MALTACAGPPDTPAGGGPTPVTVGVMPIVETAAVYVAQERGFFADAGLDVTIETANTSSAIIPGLVSGQYDIGFSNMVTFLLASEQGLELTAVAPAAGPAPGGQEDMAAVVAADPAIRSAADLVGKRVGVNALNNIAAVALRQSVRAAGGDPDGLQLVELGFAEQAAAVLNGQIDAGFTVEPYLSVAAQDGLHAVTYPYLDVDPELTIGAYLASSSTVAERPEVVEAFRTALARAVELVAGDEQVLHDAIAGFSSIDPALIPQLALPAFPRAINRPSVAGWAELMVTDGLLPAVPDVDALLLTDADRCREACSRPVRGPRRRPPSRPRGPARAGSGGASPGWPSRWRRGRSSPAPAPCPAATCRPRATSRRSSRGCSAPGARGRRWAPRRAAGSPGSRSPRRSGSRSACCWGCTRSSGR
ncbi:hypothetical protein BJF78_28675 [Pseudonocardia sp. CNS-139]|nr:hypothetical protein BJF78_28675 [Pseudonocardia sp. CNS-139]